MSENGSVLPTTAAAAPKGSLLFHVGGENGEALATLQAALRAEADSFFEKAFPRYTPQKPRVLNALHNLLTVDNLRTSIFPARPLLKSDIPSVGPKIKGSDLPEETLRQYGVVPSYDLVKSSNDDQGGDDVYDVYLYAGLYVLPASPIDFARKATFHPEEYRETKPYINDSRRCQLPSGEPAYFCDLSWMGIGGAMVLASEDGLDTAHFHLQPACTDGTGNTFSTNNVVHFDGMKFYKTIRVETGGVEEERTFTLSASISVWEGVAAFAKNQFSTSEANRETYGLGCAREILDVLARKPAP